MYLVVMGLFRGYFPSPSLINVFGGGDHLNQILCHVQCGLSMTSWSIYTFFVSPFEWVPEQLSRFLMDPIIATLLEHPGQ